MNWNTLENDDYEAGDKDRHYNRREIRHKESESRRWEYSTVEDKTKERQYLPDTAWTSELLTWRASRS